MRVIALRQLLHDLPDTTDIRFVDNDGLEFEIGEDAAIHVPEFQYLYLGEDKEGLSEALQGSLSDEELDARKRFDDEWDSRADDDEVPGVDSCAVEGSDLATRSCVTTTPDPHKDLESEEVCEPL